MARIDIYLKQQKRPEARAVAAEAAKGFASRAGRRRLNLPLVPCRDTQLPLTFSILHVAESCRIQMSAQGSGALQDSQCWGLEVAVVFHYLDVSLCL